MKKIYHTTLLGCLLLATLILLVAPLPLHSETLAVDPDPDDPLQSQFSNPLRGNLCVVSDGVSLFDKDAGELRLSVPETPMAAFLVWSGREKGKARKGFERLRIEAPDAGLLLEVVGTEFRFAPPDRKAEGNYAWYSYYYDIGQHAALFPRTENSPLTISGIDFQREEDVREPHGVGAVIIYEDGSIEGGCDFRQLELFFGNDVIFENWAGPSAAKESALVCSERLGGPPVAVDIEAEMFIGGIAGESRQSALWWQTGPSTMPLPETLVGVGNVITDPFRPTTASSGQPGAGDYQFSAFSTDDFSGADRITAQPGDDWICFQIESPDTDGKSPHVAQAASTPVDLGISASWISLFVSTQLAEIGISPRSAIKQVNQAHDFQVTVTSTLAFDPGFRITPTLVSKPASLLNSLDRDGSSCRAPTIATNIATCSIVITSSVPGIVTATAIAIIEQGGNPIVLSTANSIGGQTRAVVRFLDEGGVGYSRDWGDAPDSYATSNALGGPSHVISTSLYFGPEAPDGEPDAFSSQDFGGDDRTNVDDEGPVSPAGNEFLVGEVITVALPVVNLAGGLVFASAWLDLDNNGAFDASEQVTVSIDSGGGLARFHFGMAEAPPRSVAGRFRLSSDPAAILLPTGPAPDGEIEDHLFTIAPQSSIYDWGDAPAAIPTRFDADGPRHVAGSAVYLGATAPDIDSDGQSSADARGDDISGVADEDGLVDPGRALEIDALARVTVAVTNLSASPALLVGWLDVDGDGDLADESAVSALVAVDTEAEATVLDFGLLTGANTSRVLRLRISTAAQAALALTGEAPDGEVEDHLLTTVFQSQNFDWGDAPTGVPTLLSEEGPRHRVGSALYLGASPPDFETDGQHSNDARADDNVGIADEDGLTAPDQLLTIGADAIVSISVTNQTGLSAQLGGWLDTDGDGLLSDETPVLHEILAGTTGQPMTLAFGELSGPEAVRVLRLRISTDFDSSSVLMGEAPDGEVEDHLLSVTAPTPLDWGDAPTPYQTAEAANGPAHQIVPGLYLGLDVDSESAPRTPDADDGMSRSIELVDQYPLTLQVTTTNTTTETAELWFWIDQDGDGDFRDGPPLVSEVPAAGGVQIHNIPVDIRFSDTVLTDGATWARLRLSRKGEVLSPQGLAASGEVEDYRLRVYANRFDWGDAPEGLSQQGDAVYAYQTTQAAGGPHHLLKNDLRLGCLVDAEPDGSPDTAARGDDEHGDADDEDALRASDCSLETTLFENRLSYLQGTEAELRVLTTNSTGRDATLYTWLDVDANGAFEPGERHTVAVRSTGSSTESVLALGLIPTLHLTQSTTTYLRLRLSTDSAAGEPGGFASDGEVEDLLVKFVPSYTIEAERHPDSPKIYVTDRVTLTVHVTDAGGRRAQGGIPIVYDVQRGSLPLTPTLQIYTNSDGRPDLNLSAIGNGSNANKTVTDIWMFGVNAGNDPLTGAGLTNQDNVSIPWNQVDLLAFASDPVAPTSRLTIAVTDPETLARVPRATVFVRLYRQGVISETMALITPASGSMEVRVSQDAILKPRVIDPSNRSGGCDIEVVDYLSREAESDQLYVDPIDKVEIWVELDSPDNPNTAEPNGDEPVCIGEISTGPDSAILLGPDESVPVETLSSKTVPQLYLPYIRIGIAP